MAKSAFSFEFLSIVQRNYQIDYFHQFFYQFPNHKTSKTKPAGFFAAETFWTVVSPALLLPVESPYAKDPEEEKCYRLSRYLDNAW